MSVFNKGKRIRAIIIAIAITFATNYAISLAADASPSRSGATQPGIPPKPRSGATQPGIPPKP